MESTIQNLGIQNIEPSGLAKMISIVNPSQTRIIHITATTEDPKLSADIANEVARLSVSWLPEIMESNKPNLIQDAIVPTEKSSPSYKKNVAIGVLAGAVLCYGFFVVRHLLDDTIKSADDMEKYFGVVPLTSIPEDPAANDGSRDSEQRAGVRATLRQFAKKFKKKKKSGKKGKH